MAERVSIPGSPRDTTTTTTKNTASTSAANDLDNHSSPSSRTPMVRPIHSEPADVSPKDVSAELFPRGPGLLDLDLLPPDQMQPLPAASVSTSSSTSSFNAVFSWPSLASSSSSSAAPTRGRDPFNNTRSFSEDPFSHHSSSSSSGDDTDTHHLPPLPGVYTSPNVLHTSPMQQRSSASDGPRVYPPSSEEDLLGYSRTLPPAAVLASRPQVRQPPQGAQYDPYHSLSLELVDSLHLAMQALQYISPPQLVDNAKEQYAGCAIPIPTTTVSALLTSIRGLNYLSTNLVPLCEGQVNAVRVVDDFDVGELLQNVADQLSGEAARAEVELVIFHSDMGMKHISMCGDREGIAYVLSHVLRQIMAVASKGDAIELGLQVIPQSPSVLRRVSVASVDLDGGYARGASPRPSSPGNASSTSSGGEGHLLCVFEIVHNIAQTFDSSNAATPKAELNPFTHLAEQKQASTPKLETPLCYRLLRQVNAWLKTDTVPSSPTGFGLPRHAYELSVVLPRGSVSELPQQSSSENEGARPVLGYSGILPLDPNLPGLAEFAETLRGRKTNLHASHNSIFARHLTSYLTSWGMDVSLIPVEDNHTVEVPASPKFIIIDEDIAVLRRELRRFKTTDTPPVTVRQRSMKRPGLFRSTKSTTSIRQAVVTIIIHFTSLDKYHQVRDVVSVLAPSSSIEVMVVPKPVGPRRLLTTLFTAVRQPIVDPIFSPIATSPRSPQISSGNRTPTGGSPEGFFDSVDMLAPADPTPQKSRSPLSEVPLATIPTSPLQSEGSSRKGSSPALEVVPTTSSTSASEYFARSTSGKSSTGASGVIMQSPDGRPFGMFFEPPPSGRSVSFSARNDSERIKPLRKTSGDVDLHTSASSPSESLHSSRRASAISTISNISTTTEESGRGPESDNTAVQPPQVVRHKSMPDAKPVVAQGVAQGRERSSTVTRRAASDKQLPLITENQILRRPPKTPDVVMPPINVLIVEDNPINQNILSMFFRRKKIKYQTAKDGVEAVEKWRTGGFHLILMDIQLPVMDGIEATKAIRKLEKNNNIGAFPSTPFGDHQRPIEVAASSPFRSAVIIVALTASSLETDRVAALAAGCNDFLTKPVSLKWLEKKTVEWGCMQALIDFDGWRRWKGSDETKRGFQTGPQAAARNVASRLRIERSKGRPVPPAAAAVAAPGSSGDKQHPPLPADSTTSASTTTAATTTATSRLTTSEEKPLPPVPSE